MCSAEYNIIGELKKKKSKHFLQDPNVYDVVLLFGCVVHINSTTAM